MMSAAISHLLDFIQLQFFFEYGLHTKEVRLRKQNSSREAVQSQRRISRRFTTSFKKDNHGNSDRQNWCSSNLTVGGAKRANLQSHW
jgi:hypothetical protein